MAANPQLAPEPGRLKLDEVARLVGANVVQRRQNGHACFYLAHQNELYLYRSDPRLEKSRGLPIVICRVCGQICILITTNHLRRHDISCETYEAKFPSAPLVSPAYRKIRSDAGTVRWTPERRKQQQKKMEDCWAELTPQEKSEWLQNSANALRSDEGKKAISDGTKEAYKRLEVKKNLSEGLKNKAWKAEGNEERREQTRKRAIEVLNHPKTVKKARLAHGMPEALQHMSEGNKRSWESATPERREQTSERSIQMHARVKRLKNLEGLDLKTGLRISLAAHRSLEGLSLYAMRQDVYPDSVDDYAATKRLFTNHKGAIEAEKQRITALLESELLQREFKDLTSRLRRELNTGKTKLP